MPVQAVIHSLRRVPSPSTTATEPHPLAAAYEEVVQLFVARVDVGVDAKDKYG